MRSKNRSHSFRLLIIAVAGLWIISACTTATESSDTTPQIKPSATPVSLEDSSPPIDQDPTPTIPPPTYREPASPISMDNVAEIAYLGRLDTPGRKSTLFDWTISPDGTQLAALNNDLIMEWNLITGQLNFSTTRGNATKLRYSPDKEDIYAINNEGIVAIVGTGSGAVQNTVTLHEEFGGQIAYNMDNGWMAVNGLDGTVKVWDMPERTSLVTFDAHEEFISALAFSSDGTRLATASADSTIKIWDWQERDLLATYDLQEAYPLALTFAPDDSTLAVSTDNFVAVWDVTESELAFVLQTGESAADEVLAYSPDGEFLAVAGQQGNMRLWNTTTGNLEIELPEIGGNRVSAAFAPDTSLLATTVLNKDVSLWNLTDITDKTVGRAPLNVQSTNLFGVEWSTDGYTILFFDASGEIFVWGVPA